MKPLQPIIVTHLFPEILAELLTLLSNLSAEEWEKPTVCEGWSVKDIALHLLGDGDCSPKGSIQTRPKTKQLLPAIKCWD
jgi:hypothetical protein